ncbi:molybdopterin-guanine dinucleotide biosynthesis protein B [Muricoccus pecuniae]|uniref:Molybdopterin-guanine dinucleotide biosynthesis protein MobB n=1 Tax=Muricoccus pecuniae TaxID=693023 RepID=A0A840Y2G5_9PROT|nr:molybdopterin-guanine dinucleotide biosynthesis protein B [Roseomonas pecuniae]MBB5695288.1 molybdopterin-guanine dinucleotide biosynthesis protein MobB [Roseomonas pecuniae]
MRVFGIVGSCAAKAGIVPGLVAELTRRGLRASTIKHVPDDLDLDRPGTGSWAAREAGAEEIILASGTRHVLMRELRRMEDEPEVEALLARLSPVDIVLLEGFRLSPYPKLEAVRAGGDRRLLALDDPSVLAVTGDRPVAAPVPFLPLADRAGLADFVLAHAAEPFAPGMGLSAPAPGVLA